MSITIHGVDVPQSCWKCRFVGDGFACMFLGRRIRPHDDTRLDDCPIEQNTEVARCEICGQTFEPIRQGDHLCDVCKTELRTVVELSKEGLI